MLTFNLKKQWFDKIKSGEKTHEYREVKPYWEKRLFEHYYIYGMKSCNEKEECEFVCGYASKDDKDKRLKARIKNISIINGKNTDLAINEDVYDIEFEIIKEQTDDTLIYSLIVLLQFIKLDDLDRIIYESNCTDEVLQGIKHNYRRITNERNRKDV